MVWAKQTERGFDPSNVRYEGLVAPISRDELARFKKRSKTAAFPFPKVVWPFINSILHLVFSIILWLLLIAFPLMLIVMAFLVDNLPLSLGLGAVGIATTAYITWWLATGIRQRVHLRNPWPRWLRLTRFGADNGLIYVPESSRPSLDGTIFRYPTAGTATDRLVSRAGRRFELGNYDYHGGNRSSRTQIWGYMAIGLDRAMPHMVLRSVANSKRRRGLPAVIAADQVLRLEGNFNTYFTLHAPRTYETDALYVFAPDLMALMIDEAAAFDVEIVDDWIFFYSAKPLNLSSPAVLSKLMRIAEVVGTKTFRQTDRYRDDRVDSVTANRVAEPGRRLRVRVLVGSSAVVVAFVAIQMFRLIAGTQQFFFGN